MPVTQIKSEEVRVFQNPDKLTSANSVSVKDRSDNNTYDRTVQASSPGKDCTKDSAKLVIRRVPSPISQVIRTNSTPRLLNNYLHPNAKYVGEQQSATAKYHIKVEFKTVDLLNSLVTGFLTISGLTADLPEMTTSFRGEIINNPLHNTGTPLNKRYSFITENKSWGSFAKNDMEHWGKLTGSSNMTKTQLSHKLSSIQSGDEDHGLVYMRWKEEFLIPDSRIKSIDGASFDGFYYIVLNIGGFNRDRFRSTITPGSISGLYYHKLSEKFQSLSLRYENERDGSRVFEFQ